MVLAELFAMAIEEVPIESRQWAGIFARGPLRIVASSFAVVAHPIDVITTGAVRLGCHDPAVTVLAHSQRVGQADPIDRVSVHRHVPSMELIGVHAEQLCEQPQYHQPLNVMCVGGVDQQSHRVRDACHVRLAVPENPCI